jgi:hypothetical protein
MANGQATNSIAEAPTGMLDMSSGGSASPAADIFRNEYVSNMDRNSVLGGALAEADDGIASGFQQMDYAEAKLIGGDKTMPVVSASHSADEASGSGLISKETTKDGTAKEFLNISSISTLVANNTNNYTANGIAAADSRFDSKKVPATAAA